MTKDTAWTEKIARSLADTLPPSAKNAVTPVYYYYQSKSSNSSHQSPTCNLTKLPNAPEHVLLVVVDALRPDAAPDIGVEFGSAVTPGTWTFPAVTSLHTSLYPHEHGSVAHTHPEDEEFAMPQQYSSRETIAHTLESAGYETYAGCAFITPFLAVKSWYQSTRVYDFERAENVISDYLSWRDERPQTFGYLHLGDLHNPLNPPEQYKRPYDIDESLDLAFPDQWAADFDGSPEAQHFHEQRVKLYRAALDYVSDQLRDLLSEVGDDTLVVVTGDHGESQFEHAQKDRVMSDSRPNYGVGHGGTPFDELARVPVAVSVPGEGTVVPTGGWGSLIDIPQTISERVLETHHFSGYDWAEDIPVERAVICEACRYGTERKAIYRGSEFLIHSKTDNVTFTGTVTSDGVSFNGQVQDEGALLSELPDAWDDFGSGHSVSEVAESQLRALGYK
ncbi:sulfatase-like hydrolase/transferase [Salinigranum halophilum]|uniref:sulfatase-like hydrolase/transferase n=1 Tax=Salinigranum halophilum TaxID=2565931 RepID=UPI00115F1444|nr:sulfatase-like hydrolase/transferase [Salinigranum halophilum]